MGALHSEDAALPKLYYHMAVGHTSVSKITRVSWVVRAIIRQRFSLSNDTTIGYFHVSIRGLVPGCDHIIDPHLAKDIYQCHIRLTKMTFHYKSRNQFEIGCPYPWHYQIRRSLKLRTCHQQVLVTASGNPFLIEEDCTHCQKVRIGVLHNESQNQQRNARRQTIEQGAWFPKPIATCFRSVIACMAKEVLPQRTMMSQTLYPPPNISNWRSTVRFLASTWNEPDERSLTAY